MNSVTPLLKLDFYYAILNKDLSVYYTCDDLYDFLSIKNDSHFLIYTSIFKNYIRNKNNQLLKLHPDSNEEIYYFIKHTNSLYFVFIFDLSHFKILEQMNRNFIEEIYLNKSILNNFQDGIFITDENGEVLFINDSFTLLSGLDFVDVVGHNVFELLEKQIVPNSCCARVIKSGMSVATINKYYSGKECLVSGIPILNSKGEMKKVISTIRDLSELLSIKLELEKTTSLSKIYKKRVLELESLNNHEPIITRSKKMNDIYEMVSNVSSIDCTVLILGETGVGKDFISNYIHNISTPKYKGPFIKVNCSAIPEHLLESELFGYEAGAFTGASKDGKIGLFELANNGTLFLDEIGDMPYVLQSKLLSVIQDKVMFRVGGNEKVNINARIISATNSNLEEKIKQKMFRADLYYRLNVVNITIPPLRERKEDIVPLVTLFIKQFNTKYNKNKYFSSNAYNVLLDYHWPGNVREMKNIIERLLIITKSDCIDSNDLYSQFSSSHSHKVNNKDFFPYNDETFSLKENLEVYESLLIESSLNKFSTLQDTADHLKISLSTLVRKKSKYNL